MINPNEIINYNRTDAELEELILFLVVVAGKKASTMSRLLNNFLFNNSSLNPFDWIKRLDELLSLNYHIKNAGFGQHNRVTRAFRELANSNLNLRTCTLEDLMKIHGIGLKSASCFLMWTRPNQQLAGLDTHLLAELRDLGYDAPKSTPSSYKEYMRLQGIVLELANQSGLSPAEWDLQVWKRRANK